MITTINITGQINGNSTLCRAIQTHNSVTTRNNFYGYTITFKTKREAKKALWDAYKFLRLKEPEFKSGFQYSKYGSLKYDASSAQITV